MSELTRDLPAIDARAAAAQTWDLIVIGAGPAGAIAAFHGARRGCRVLLVEKQRFPRPKVCGCCLNSAALELLSDCGLADLPFRAAAQRLWALEFGTSGKTALLRLPTGAALSRETLDALLVSEAIRAGASFLPATSASVEPVANGARRVGLSSAGENTQAAAHVVLVADGLAGRAVRNCTDLKSIVAPRSRVGGNTVMAGPIRGYDPGVIYMACARGGYVGLVVLEDNRLDIATALDVGFVQRQGGLGRSAVRVLAEAGFSIPAGLEGASWHGTPRLTFHRSPIASQRIFLIGDAAGYVEPFTGEGIAWALATGTAVAPYALSAVDRWEPALARDWARRYRQILSVRQRRCHIITRMLRHPVLARTIVTALAWFPALARPAIAGINRPLLHHG